MFCIYNKKAEKFGVIDTDDGVVEYLTKDELKKMRSLGIKIHLANMLETPQDFINRLSEKYMASSGKSDLVIGEICRALCRIGYRYLNDGDKLGLGYGRETVNPAMRYLLAKIPSKYIPAYSIDINDEGSMAYSYVSDSDYEVWLESLFGFCVIYIIKNKESLLVKNTEDMFDYRDAKLDVDVDPEEDEEEYEDYMNDADDYNEDDEDWEDEE